MVTSLDVVAQRALAKTKKVGDCLFFMGSRYRNGYGKISRSESGKVTYFLTHRLVYEQVKGQIPDGHHVRHTCDHPPCINPDHLLTGTPKENMRDMVERGRQRKPNLARTHCANGHPLTPDNVFPRKARHGLTKLGCRACQRNSVRQYGGYLGHVHNASKTHCKRGHELNEQNVSINKTSGGRQCRACRNLWYAIKTGKASLDEWTKYVIPGSEDDAEPPTAASPTPPLTADEVAAELDAEAVQ